MPTDVRAGIDERLLGLARYCQRLRRRMERGMERGRVRRICDVDRSGTSVVRCLTASQREKKLEPGWFERYVRTWRLWLPVGDWLGHAQGGEWTAPKGKCALPKVPDLMGEGTQWREGKEPQSRSLRYLQARPGGTYLGCPTGQAR